ncbi:MAG: S9 family peptidase, partial [Chloroflexi bacterium]|nr:S9 family peptidase [Chloroflexota bacterium]
MPDGQRGYQVEDLFRLKTVTDAQISPDGGQVAYVVGHTDREADQTRSAVWVVNRDGSGARSLTGGGSDSQPRWSADGRHLAFVSGRENSTSQVYVLSLAGGEARRLTSFPRGVLEIAWSPDSRRIAVVARVGGPEGPREKRDALPKVVSNLKHKFNGQGFFDGSRRHIYVVDLEGGEPRQLTAGECDEGQIAWSPDSSRVVFVSARHDTRDRDQAQDIWTVAAAGGDVQPLTERFGPCSAPVYSPDGQTIAFAGHTDITDTGGRTASLWVMPVAGGSPRNVTAALDRSIQAGPLNPGAPPARFDWTADGVAIVARVQDGAEVHLFRIVVADGSMTRLADGERVVESFSTAADGTVAAVISDPRHPSEVYLVHGAERRLTGTNDALMAELRLPDIDPVKVTMPDGRTVEGWVSKPLDMEPGRQYPLVLDIHGGPHGAFLHAFRAAYPLALPALGC